MSGVEAVLFAVADVVGMVNDLIDRIALVGENATLLCKLQTRLRTLRTLMDSSSQVSMSSLSTANNHSLCLNQAAGIVPNNTLNPAFQTIGNGLLEILTQVNAFADTKFIPRANICQEGARMTFRFLFGDHDQETLESFCSELSTCIQDATFQIVCVSHVEARDIASRIVSEVQAGYCNHQNVRDEIGDVLSVFSTTSADERREMLELVKKEIISVCEEIAKLRTDLAELKSEIISLKSSLLGNDLTSPVEIEVLKNKLQALQSASLVRNTDEMDEILTMVGDLSTTSTGLSQSLDELKQNANYNQLQLKDMINDKIGSLVDGLSALTSNQISSESLNAMQQELRSMSNHSNRWQTSTNELITCHYDDLKEKLTSIAESMKAAMLTSQSQSIQRISEGKMDNVSIPSVAIQDVEFLSSSMQPVAKISLESSIGRGGSSLINRVRSDQYGLCALKRVDASIIALHQRLFKREVMIQQRMRHGNIVKILACNIDEGLILMELGNYSLQSLVYDAVHANHRPSDMEMIHYFIQASSALSYLHSLGIIHRDIKPGNFIMFDNSLKIGDFGLAKMKEDNATMTIGQAKGTVAYMAPELFMTVANANDKVPYSSASDVYSLAISLNECLIRQLPFDRVPESAILMKVSKNERPALLNNVTGLSLGGINQLIQDGWQSDPILRPTGFQFQTRLNNALNPARSFIRQDTRSESIIIPSGQRDIYEFLINKAKLIAEDCISYAAILYKKKVNTVDKLSQRIAKKSDFLLTDCQFDNNCIDDVLQALGIVIDVSEAPPQLSSPLTPLVSEDEREMYQFLKQQAKLTDSNSARYAKLLTGKGCHSVVRLIKKLRSAPNFLSNDSEMLEDDIEDVKAALAILSNQEGTVAPSLFPSELHEPQPDALKPHSLMTSSSNDEFNQSKTQLGLERVTDNIVVPQAKPVDSQIVAVSQVQASQSMSSSSSISSLATMPNSQPVQLLEQFKPVEQAENSQEGSMNTESKDSSTDDWRNKPCQNELDCRRTLVAILKQTRGDYWWNNHDEGGEEFNWQEDLNLSEWNGLAFGRQKRIELNNDGLVVKLYLHNLEMHGDMPEIVGNLVSLTHLFIENNKVSSLPKSLCKLSHLQELNASDNQLSVIPKALENLAALRYLMVARNPAASNGERRQDIRKRFGKRDLNKFF